MICHIVRADTVSSMRTTPDATRMLRPVAAALVGVEALAIAVGAIVVLVRALGGDGALELSAAVAVMAIVLAIPLGFGAWALARGRTWPRGLAVTWQVLQVAAGVTLLDWSVAGGVAVIGVAVVAGAALLADARAAAGADVPREVPSPGDAPGERSR